MILSPPNGNDRAHESGESDCYACESHQKRDRHHVKSNRGHFVLLQQLRHSRCDHDDDRERYVHESGENDCYARGSLQKRVRDHVKSDCDHFRPLQQLHHRRRDHDDDYERSDYGDRPCLLRQRYHGPSHSRDDDRGRDSV